MKHSILGLSFAYHRISSPRLCTTTLYRAPRNSGLSRSCIHDDVRKICSEYIYFNQKKILKPKGIFKLRYRDAPSIPRLWNTGRSPTPRRISQGTSCSRWNSAATKSEPVLKTGSDDEDVIQGVMQGLDESPIQRALDEDTANC